MIWFVITSYGYIAPKGPREHLMFIWNLFFPTLKFRRLANEDSRKGSR